MVCGPTAALGAPAPQAAAEGSATPPAVSRAAATLGGAASRAVAPPAAKPRLTADDAVRVGRTSSRLRDWIADHPISRTTATRDAKTGIWTAWFVSRDPKTRKERTEAQVLVSDATGRITEVRTGPQVAWMMARGYDGAFGRAITRQAIWTSLCLAFLIPLLRPGRLISWRTLDLLALLGFSLSLIWFNRGEIFTSVPLQYPPLVYLALRLTWIGLRRARAPASAEGVETAPPASRTPALRAWFPTWLMVTVLAATLALRYGLNAFDSNVIDVGYAGVIGAERIQEGRSPYGTFPSDCGRCDTYGPLNYIAYVPFEATSPWHGRWDDLPAAHGAATFFDVLCIAGMLVLGWLLAGLRLGVGLALAWAAFPFTAYALESNANDSLVAACLIWGLVLARRPLGRGLALGLACATKFAPIVLLLLWGRHPFPRAAGSGVRRVLFYVGGLAASVLLTGWVLLLDGLSGVREFWSRTVGYQIGRDSPFSIWGQHPGLRPLQIALVAVVLLGAVIVVRRPRRLDLLAFTALSGALIIGLELTLTHWFYLYLPWFLPFALLAIVPEWTTPAPREAPERLRPEPERVLVPA